MLNERESRIVGKRIGDYRRMHKLSQAELGEMTGLSRNIINQMELGRMRYQQKGERVTLKPIAELFGISVNDLLVDIRESAEEEKDMESNLVKELTEEIKKLKEENKNLEDRADMWKERVAEIKKERDNLLVAGDDETLTKAMAEVERQRDYINTLEDKIRLLEANQKSPLENIVLNMMVEKYGKAEIR